MYEVVRCGKSPTQILPYKKQTENTTCTTISPFPTLLLTYVIINMNCFPILLISLLSAVFYKY